MKWVTRDRPKIDRLACPWLIRRFIDADAEIQYVPAAEVLAVAESEGAIPFDVPGIELTHSGPLCSFDAFLEKYRLEDAALARLAEIVRAADTDTIVRRRHRDYWPFRWVSVPTSRMTRSCCKPPCRFTTLSTPGAARSAASVTAGIRKRSSKR